MRIPTPDSRVERCYICGSDTRQIPKTLCFVCINTECEAQHNIFSPLIEGPCIVLRFSVTLPANRFPEKLLLTASQFLKHCVICKAEIVGGGDVSMCTTPGCLSQYDIKVRQPKPGFKSIIVQMTIQSEIFEQIRGNEE